MLILFIAICYFTMGTFIVRGALRAMTSNEKDKMSTSIMIGIILTGLFWPLTLLVAIVVTIKDSVSRK